MDRCILVNNRVVRRYNFFNPTQPIPPIATYKLWTHKPTQPTSHNPIELHTNHNKRSGTGRPFLIYQSVNQVVLISNTYTVGGLEMYRNANLQHSLILITNTVYRPRLWSFRIFGNVSDPRPNPTHQKVFLKISAQPNPWVDPTHV